MLARDLANSPPGHLTATRMADVATEVGKASGLGVEVFDARRLVELGCGGLLGVNAGSAEPPRMIKLTYRPRRAAKAAATSPWSARAMMYDSGGISLKPSDPMHAAMKMDMSGAAAVLASMSALAALGCRNAVTGYLMCTDNMPSGSAMKLGDVLHDPRRQDRRGPQHRRRGPPRARRRARRSPPRRSPTRSSTSPR